MKIDEDRDLSFELLTGRDRSTFNVQPDRAKVKNGTKWSTCNADQDSQSS